MPVTGYELDAQGLIPSKRKRFFSSPQSLSLEVKWQDMKLSIHLHLVLRS
jgi:hypothetical protein